MILNNKWLIILLLSTLLLHSQDTSTLDFFDAVYKTENDIDSNSNNTNQPTKKEIQTLVKAYLLETKDPIAQLYNEPITQKIVENFFIQKSGSKEIAETVLLYTTKKKLPIGLVFSLVFVESSFSQQAVNYNSTTSDFGLFQLNSRTFRHLKKEEFFHLETNVDMGTSYLQYAFNLHSDPKTALAIYNAGPRRPLRGETPESTKLYVSRILNYYHKLEKEFIQYTWNIMQLSELEEKEV